MNKVNGSIMLLATILAVTIVTAFTLDFGRFKGRIESFVTELLGREVRIDGPLHLTLGGTIDLSAEDVRLASTDWSTEPELASIARLEASIDTWSLIRETLRIESLVIEGARLNLEKNAEGTGNWSLFEQTEDREEESESPESLPLTVDDTRITDVILSYAAPDRPTPLILTMSALTAKIDDAGRLAIALDGDVNKTPLMLEVTVGLVEDLIALNAIDLELSGNLGEIGLQGDASFANLRAPSRPTARLTLNGPNVEYLADVFGIDPVTSGPLDLSLSIAAVGERMQLNLSGDAGEFAILVNGQFDDLQQLENMDLQMSASGPNAQTVADLLGWPEVPDDPFSVIGTIQRAGSDVSIEDIRVTIGQTQFDINGQFDDFPDPNTANASVRINGPDFGRFNRLLGLPGRLEGPFEVVANLVSLETGDAKLDMTASAQDIALSAQGTIADTPDFVGTELRIDFSGPNLSVITRAAGRQAGPEEPFTGRLSVERVADGAIIEDGEATIGEDRFAFNGRIGDELPFSWAFQFEATLPDVKTRLAGFGLEYEDLPAGDLKASGSIQSEGDGYVLEDVAIVYAGAEAELSGRVGALPALEGTVLEVQASGQAFSRLLPARDEFSELDKPFDIVGNVSLVDGTLTFSDVEFQLDETRVTGNVELGLDEIPGHGSFSLEASSPDIFVYWPNLTEVAAQEEGPLELRASGEWAGSLWNIDEFDMQFADGSLKASGTVDGPPDFDATDLRFDWTIPSLSNFSALAGHELPDEPAHLRFTATGTRDEMSVHDLDGVFGDSDISGEYHIRDGDVLTLEANLFSNRLNLTPYLPPEPETPTEQESDAEPGDGRLIPDVPVRIDVLEDFLANVSLRIDEVNIRERTLSDVSLNATVADGALRVDEFELEDTNVGALSGVMVLQPSEAGPEFGLRLLGEDISIGLPAFSPEEFEDLPRYELNLALITNGDTLREMAGNMNGYLRLIGGEGRMRVGAMPIFTQDFLYELFQTLNPFSAEDSYSNLKCIAILAAIESGTLVGDPVLVLQSDRLNIFADATIDLKTESVDADFNTVPQQGLGFSLSSLVNPYVKVSGTLANPSLGFDPESTLIEGGAAVATGGLSILAKSFAERFLSSRDPCGEAISDADEQFRALEERYGRFGSTQAQ